MCAVHYRVTRSVPGNLETVNLLYVLLEAKHNRFHAGFFFHAGWPLVYSLIFLISTDANL
jgi:hypothetical protein